jgi:hypothetical protein
MNFFRTCGGNSAHCCDIYLYSDLVCLSVLAESIKGRETQLKRPVTSICSNENKTKSERILVVKTYNILRGIALISVSHDPL